MTFSILRHWLLALCVALLAGCGGGGSGSAGTPIVGPGSGSGSGSGTGGGTTSAPTVTVSLSSSTVTAASPATVTVTVRDAAGVPISGTVVDLSTKRGTFASLSVSSVRTDANGNGTATLSAASAGQSGADDLLATATLGTTTVDGSASFTVAGSQPTISLTISSTTLRGSSGAATLVAVVRNAAGVAQPGVLVNFKSTSGKVTLGAASVVTDAAALNASVTAAPADPSTTVADTLVASATVDGVTVQSQLPVQVVADVPTITLQTSGSPVTAAVPVTLSILVKDARGNPVGAGAMVSVASSFGLVAFDAASVSTSAAGIAQVVMAPKTAASNGADQVVVTAAVGGVTATSQAVIQVASAPTASVSVSIAPTTVTTGVPATVTVTVRDAKGSPVPGALVALSTARGGLATLSVSSVATNASGTATATLSAASAAVGGADQVVGTVTTGGATVQGNASFTVAGGQATLSLIVGKSTLQGAADSTTLSATVRDATGAILKGVPVSFASLGGRATLSAQSMLSDAVTGVATVTISPAVAGVTAAETLTASAVVGSTTVQGSVAVQLLAATPSLNVTASPASASAGAPATLRVTVFNASGSAVGANEAVVSIASTYGLSSFDASTASTSANGQAVFLVTPKTATSNGADVIVVATTVGGVPVSKQAVVQISSAPSNTVALALSSPTVTPASQSTVTVTTRDAAGNLVPGVVVDLATVRGNLATPSVSSVLTSALNDATYGTATLKLTANGSGLSGADQVVAVIRGTTVQASASFNVAGSAPTLNLLAGAGPVRQSTGPVSLTATVRDATGALASPSVVAFASASGKVKFSSLTATSSAGVAQVTMLPVDPSVSVADTVTASTTIGGVPVQTSIPVQVQADVPSLTVTPDKSTVTATSPATLTLRVRDTSNANAPDGTIVNVQSVFGLSVFDAATASTTGGVATVTVTPKTNSSNGADQIVATATVGGVSTSGSTVLQVSSSTFVSPPTLVLGVLPSSINSATPGTVTATLKDGNGSPVPGQVVTFTVVRGLARTNVGTALTQAASGQASVLLVPASSTTAGADEVTASANFAGVALQATKGFEISASNVSLTSFTSAVAMLGAYGQTTLTVGITGAAAGSPVNVTVTSSCVSQGKATLSPASFTATTATVDLQYKDNGCGAIQDSDKLQAAITGATGAPVNLTLPIVKPDQGSLAFISASPEIIFIKASGFTEVSTLTFEVRDTAGNALPGQQVAMDLLTQTGGLTLNGGTATVTQTSDATGRVTARINAGAVPTPVRVKATLLPLSSPAIATVSSNLSVGVGLPSQLNFSLSQQTFNIEGFNIDGTTNTYSVIMSDRNGNPVPTGTSINFVAEGGQIESVVQTSATPVAPVPGSGTGLSTAVARFQSSSPRPPDGRVTITAYALGEESFIDQNGNNTYDAGEPFQDLGNIFKDRIFDGLFDAVLDEYVSTNINSSSACAAAGNALLALDATIPSAPGTCDGVWSGAGKVYVRRATETVLSTSGARALWAHTGGATTSGLESGCSKVTLQTGPAPTTSAVFTQAQSGETWYTGALATSSTTLPFIVADANTFAVPGPGGTVGRLNPMAAKTTITATTPTAGVALTFGGTPVPSTTEASKGSVGVDFGPTATATTAVVFVNFTSPSGTVTTYTFNVQRAARPTTCP